MEKKSQEFIEKDDIEKFIEAESDKTAKELIEIQEELLKVTKRLSDYLNVLDGEIKIAYEMGDEKLWLSLTNRKAIILQRLSELTQILNK